MILISFGVYQIWEEKSTEKLALSFAKAAGTMLQGTVEHMIVENGLKRDYW